MDRSPLVRTWSKQHGIRIPYRAGRRHHHYLPDILVEYVDGRVFLEEIKGCVWDRLQFSRKNLEALFYCSTRGIVYRIVREEQLGTVD